MSALKHGPDEECQSCYECPGCGGGDGSTPKRAHLRIRPGVVHLVCSDCDGDGVLCPNYDPLTGGSTPLADRQPTPSAQQRTDAGSGPA